MNRNSLAKAIAKKTRLSHRQAENLVIATDAVITEALEEGDKVIYSNFGSFYTIEYPSKTIKHPKSGEKMIMLPTKVVKFMPSEALKKYINNDSKKGTPDTNESGNEEPTFQEIPITIKRKNLPESQINVPVEENSKEIKKTDKQEPHTEKTNFFEKLLGIKSGTQGKNPTLHKAHIEDNIEEYHKHSEASRYSKQESKTPVLVQAKPTITPCNEPLTKAHLEDNIEEYHKHSAAGRIQQNQTEQPKLNKPAPKPITIRNELLEKAHLEDDIESYHRRSLGKETEEKSTTHFNPALKKTSIVVKKDETILDLAHTTDDIETYHQSKTKQEKNNIYEEILSDGGREFSTVNGAIKIPRPKKNMPEKNDEESRSPLDILRDKLGLGIAKKQSEDLKSEQLKPTSSEDVNEPEATSSLAGNGIFDKNLAHSQPMPTTAATPSNPEEQNALQKIDEIKDELKEGSDNATIEKSEAAPIDNSAEEDHPPLEHDPIFSKAGGSFTFDKARIEYRDLSKIMVPKELLSKIPENIARSYKSVAFEEVDNIISVAMVDPEDIENREMLKRLLGAKIKIYLATEADISFILNQYQGLENEVSSAIANAEEIEEAEEEKDSAKVKSPVETVSDDAPAAKIVSSLLKRAIRDKASDIHIEPTEKEVEVRFRIDGVLRKKVSLPREIQAAVISRIKILSNLKIDEQRVPQDGRFNIHLDNRRVDFRVSSMPVAFGEKVVMRILDKSSGILSIEQLGIRGSGLGILEDNLSKSHGMVLVTGPTGSGKSTTLYAMIQKVYNEGVNIITLEDPIEYQMQGINQSQVNSDIGYSFAAGLRSILRQDPDIIMLGEIRDRETAEMAVHAALTGHVVLSTLHTNDAAGAAPRMIDMGVEPFLLTSSINVVVGQRLVRVICPECKEELKISDVELASIKAEMNQMPQKTKEEALKKELKFFKGRGCKNCDNSGYKGRLGIYEVLAITPEMQSLILKRVSSAELNKLAIEQGMVTMIQDGILKALDGITTMEEVWRATKN